MICNIPNYMVNWATEKAWFNKTVEIQHSQVDWSIHAYGTKTLTISFIGDILNCLDAYKYNHPYAVKVGGACCDLFGLSVPQFLYLPHLTSLNLFVLLELKVRGFVIRPGFLSTWPKPISPFVVGTTSPLINTIVRGES